MLRVQLTQTQFPHQRNLKTFLLNSTIAGGGAQLISVQPCLPRKWKGWKQHTLQPWGVKCAFQKSTLISRLTEEHHALLLMLRPCESGKACAVRAKTCEQAVEQLWGAEQFMRPRFITASEFSNPQVTSWYYEEKCSICSRSETISKMLLLSFFFTIC